MGMIANLRRDWETVGGIRKLLNYAKDLGPDSANLVADDLEKSVDKHRQNIAFRFEGSVQTYGEYDARASQVANWALGQGYQAGDVVALFMGNCPDYVAIWTGLAKIGVVTALINHNLEDKGLAHCINIAEAKAVVIGEEQAVAMQGALDLLDGAPAIWQMGGSSNSNKDLSAALQDMPDARPDRSHRANLRGKDLCAYVYTSGTTGLPKAARLTQTRMQGMLRTFVMPTRTTERDRVLITLPLYHGTGGLCGVGIALMTGASVILVKKFSASKFWDTAADEGATRFVYIGELCRYLLNQPRHPKERAHKITGGFGNGLRPEIWQQFLDRFGIERLTEFYGSTEGNVSFLNFDGKVGAVGRIPKLIEKKFGHVAFVKFDVENEEPVRGDDGMCVPAKPGEAGEVLGLIGADARTSFEGYNDEEATKKKILRDVYTKGDQWFRTGDLMMKDEDGYIYFIDRIGDTFRWKGENVSTNEVGKALSQYPGIKTANVYGVQVQGTDGKAGMAAITADQDVDYDGLANFLKSSLPAYAVPLFIRVQQEAETTGTFKFRKVELVKEGFDPNEVTDPIWFLHPEQGQFVPLTPDRFDSIRSGGFRF